MTNKQELKFKPKLTYKETQLIFRSHVSPLDNFLTKCFLRPCKVSPTSILQEYHITLTKICKSLYSKKQEDEDQRKTEHKTDQGKLQI